MKQLMIATNTHIGQNRRAPVVFGILESTAQGITRSNTNKKINQPNHPRKLLFIIFSPSDI
jgi:hypothetical protein